MKANNMTHEPTPPDPDSFRTRLYALSRQALTAVAKDGLIDKGVAHELAEAAPLLSIAASLHMIALDLRSLVRCLEEVDE